MKKTILVAMSIALMLVAFASCSNDNGKPGFTGNAGEVAAALDPERLINDALRPDAIGVAAEYRIIHDTAFSSVARTTAQVSLQATVAFRGYEVPDSAFIITGGTLVYMFDGTISSSGVFTALGTASVKTGNRLIVDTPEGNAEVMIRKVNASVGGFTVDASKADSDGNLPEDTALAVTVTAESDIKVTVGDDEVTIKPESPEAARKIIRDEKSLIEYLSSEDDDIGVVPAGARIELTSAVDITKPDKTLKGESGAEIVLDGAKIIDQQALFRISSDNVTIDGIRFSVNGNGTDLGKYNIIKVSGSASAPVRNVQLRNIAVDAESGVAGINFHFTSGGVIENVSVSGMPGKASLSIAESEGLAVRNCSFVPGSWGYAVQLNWDNNGSYAKGVDVAFDGVGNIPSVYATEHVGDGNAVKHTVKGLDSFVRFESLKAFSANGEYKETGTLYLPKESATSEILGYISGIGSDRIFNRIDNALGSPDQTYSNKDGSTVMIAGKPSVSGNTVTIGVWFTAFPYSTKSEHKVTGYFDFTFEGVSEQNEENVFKADSWTIKSSYLDIDGEHIAVLDINGGFQNGPARLELSDAAVTGIANAAQHVENNAEEALKFSGDNLEGYAGFDGKAFAF